MCAAIRQGKAKAGAEELARTIRRAIPIISDVPGFRLLRDLCPDDTVTAISIFDDHAGAESPTNACMDRAGLLPCSPDQPQR